MLGMKLEHHLKSLLESNDGMRRHWCRLDADKPLIHDSIVCLLWLSAWLSLRSSVLEWWALGYMVACRKSAGDDFSDCVQQLVTVVLRGCTHIQSLIAYSLSNTIVFLLWVAATASWVCQTTTFLFISTLELSSGTCRWKTWFEKDLFCMCLTCARLKYIGQVFAALLHKILLANEFDMFLKEAFVGQ